MNDCTPDGSPLSSHTPAWQQAQEHHRDLLARREQFGRKAAHLADINERFHFACADDLSRLLPNGSPDQMAMRLIHKRTGQEHCVVVCRSTPFGPTWEVLWSPWFDDEADLYIAAVQERVAENRARRLQEAASRRDGGDADQRDRGDADAFSPEHHGQNPD